MSSLITSLSLPVGWSHRLSSELQAVWQRTTLRQCQPTVVPTRVEHQPVALSLRATLPPGQTAVVYIAVEGELNRHTYMQLIEIAYAHYQQGRRYLMLDLRQTTQIELSGLFALLSVARLYSGQPLLDPEAGWVALRQGAESATPGLGERVKLIAPSPSAAGALARAHFCQFLTRYSDLDTALKTIRG